MAVAAEKMSPSGKVSIESTSIAAGIGVSWGDGKLSFKGKQVSFSVDGLSLVDFGISKASAVGDVYNLTDVSKFEGSYVAAEARLCLGRRHGWPGATQSEWRGHTSAFRFPRRETATRYERIGDQAEAIKSWTAVRLETSVCVRHVTSVEELSVE